MKKSCTYCNRIHAKSYDCKQKPKRTSQPTSKDRFRWTTAWQDKREQVKQRDLYLCQSCKQQGRYNYTATEVHHIVPLEENFELRLDDSNLITLCKRCHELAEKDTTQRQYLQSITQKRL